MMMPLPNFLKRFQKEAREHLKSGLVKDIEFSGATYQVLVQDSISKEETWAFLQLDPRGRLKDSFCSCTEGEENHRCVHQAAAFLYIYGSYNVPLHKRFENSLWNILCRSSSDQVPYYNHRPKVSEVGKRFSCETSEGKEFFSIQASTQKMVLHLNEIFFNRIQETEETSLKFSNLSEEDIFRWQQGRPTLELIYELSFWSDLAKWLLYQEESKISYTINFVCPKKKLPKAIDVSFPEIQLNWILDEELLSSIIPSLINMKTSLHIQNALKEGNEKIIYNQSDRRFVLIPKEIVPSKEERKDRVKGIELGDWLYIPDKGFYSKNYSESLKNYDWSDVERVLAEHASTMQPLISDIIIHEMPIGVSFSIVFDEQWNLHIEEYLFSPGDLSAPGSQCFKSWVYLEGKGFYRVEGRDFEEIHTIIPSNGVQDFVSQSRIWLNTQEGFRTHLIPLEADLSYQVTPGKGLTFSRNVDVRQNDVKTKDFGRWVYVEDLGFFPKEIMQTSLPIRSGMIIPIHQIAIFIRMNQDDLHFIKNFFSPRCPIARSGLTIQLNEKEQIEVFPQYEILPDYLDKVVQFFDDYVYVEGEGFHEIPGSMRLPEHYRQPVTIDEDGIANFLRQDLPQLSSFVFSLDLRLKKPQNHSLVAEQIEHSEDRSDYALKLNYQTEFGTLTLASLWAALNQNKRFVFSEAGFFDLSDRRFNWVRNLRKTKIQLRNNKASLSSFELIRLNVFEEITLLPGKDSTHLQSLRLLKELTEFRAPEEPHLEGLRSHLRPYQHIGVKWLWFLYQHSLSGLLCDDMGLGKTHQTMGLLIAIANHFKKNKNQEKRHFLIICPTSVIYHWQEKLSEFLPELRVGTFYGINRSLDKFYEECDILLTSYGIWRNEVEKLSKLKFEVAIFDELQIAKNQTSRIYRALLKAQSRIRIGLTGTPIENRLRELKSLFDIVLPTYLPNDSDYREFFIRPIEKEENIERKQLLQRLIKPFVLRRKKEDVLIDLPEKTEEIAHCDLLPQQQDLYADQLLRSRERIIHELQDEQNPIPYIHIFALLSHLKQICNHPAAYLKKPEEYKNYQSGKWELFTELLTEARESGQKVVVFSQYLAMLDIMTEYLKEHNIGYASIRGATINRGEQVQRFNKDPSCEIFIASLQAAGLGIDLTAASVVIHYDRWWNAARENQATDRVHRIGQKRGVQVFKLITKNTLEEHIDFLINRKKRLLEEVVGADDHQVIKEFDRKELMVLLQALPNEALTSSTHL